MATRFCGFLVVSFLLMAQAGHAVVGPDECGLYELTGTIDKNPNASGYLYIVNKGTVSEYQFRIPLRQEPMIAPYVSRSSRIRVIFSSKIENFRGTFSRIESVSHAAADPLGLSGARSLNLVSNAECTE